MCDHVPALNVRFDVGVPEEDYTFIPVIWCKQRERVKHVITSTVLTSCMTHFHDGRTRPCYAPVAPCRGCREGLPRLWKGYLGGINFHTKAAQILMLTPNAVRPYKARFAAGGDQIRGYILTAQNENGAKHGKQWLEWSCTRVAGELPAPIDVEAQLKGMWMRSAAERDPNDADRWEMIPIPGE